MCARRDRAPKPGLRSAGYAHPEPKEERLDAFREMVLREAAHRDAHKVAVVGHAAFFKELVGIKMTACQMLWKPNLDPS